MIFNDDSQICLDILEPECPICLDVLDIESSLITTKCCNHAFHDNCYTKCMQEKLICPICRAVIPGNIKITINPIIQEPVISYDDIICNNYVNKIFNLFAVIIVIITIVFITFKKFSNN